jgi:catechol 2,3-dioxygenase-like lactoylglutathione lyase family enzyme
MLQQSRITIMLPVKDLDRARQFYEDRIGFQAGSQSADGKFIYACGDAFIALFPKDSGTRADHLRFRHRSQSVDFLDFVLTDEHISPGGRTSGVAKSRNTFF